MSDKTPETGGTRDARLLRQAETIAAARKATADAAPYLAALTRRTDTALTGGKYPDELAISLDFGMVGLYMARALALVDELLADAGRCDPATPPGSGVRSAQQDGEAQQDSSGSRYEHQLRRSHGLAAVRRALGHANWWLSVPKRRTDAALRRLEYPDERKIRGDLLTVRGYLEKAAALVDGLVADEWRY